MCKVGRVRGVCKGVGVKEWEWCASERRVCSRESGRDICEWEGCAR